MLWIEVVRIFVPGMILGIVVGKLLAERPSYFRLMSPKFWSYKAKRASKKKWIQILILSGIFGFLSYFVALGIREIAGPFLSEENIFTGIASFSPTLLIISITILPIMEEWIFRGIILDEISRLTKSEWKGLLFSSLLFAIFHLSNPGTYLAAIFPYFVGGMIIGVSYLVGGLSVAVFSHVLYNLLPFFL
ncbi:hypothetical protein AKJ57_00585 [candidate division MSBL1 archaeon SCGC-AAA259A05]|uniref:CAAX prenyl protease 2/Lysostaphin resistance protein A-like domain-containing protein n=1 Tax=candidate division MSBL1 archaeon SCGC-AAA259A05 TaxID=1698259 RepID=A0A133UBT4_9EURY|nr:hypothetical protein AKJ57_00585 [candidate division MSBL1 archaeon SCGC-AAA259A05]